MNNTYTRPFEIAGTFEDPTGLSKEKAAYDNFRICKVFQGKDNFTTSISFNPSGEFAITTSTNHTLQLYNCGDGTRKKIIPSLKYGCNLAVFSQEDKVVYASTKIDDALRYLSLETNGYIRYFKGHKDKVTSLVYMPSVATSLNQSLDCENNNFCSNSESLTNIDYNPYTGNNYTKSKIKKGSTPSLKDVFVTGSLDKTVKLWDLNVESSVLSTTISDSHAEFGISVDFDPTGVVVGIASGHQIKLHDIRYFGKGPFLSADIEAQLKDDLNTPQFLSFVSSEPIKNVITGLRFGKLSGENMIVSTTKGDKFVVDSFSGKVLLNLESVRDSNYRYDSGIRSSNYYQRNSHNFDFSPCEKYVVSGDNDGKICVWNVYDPLNKLVLREHSLEKSGLSETLVVKNCSLWESTRKSPVYSLGLSPGFLMAISGSDDLSFWEPF